MLKRLLLAEGWVVEGRPPDLFNRFVILNELVVEVDGLCFGGRSALWIGFLWHCLLRPLNWPTPVSLEHDIVIILGNIVAETVVPAKERE